MSLSWMRGIKWRWMRGGCTGHATIVKDEAAETSINIPLLHRSLYVEASNPFFKGLNLQAFFTIGCNRRMRGLQVQVCANFFHRLAVLSSCAPLMLNLHIGGVLELAHSRKQAENLLNRRQRLVSLLPSPSSSSRW
jgi:hypothetical protein